MYALLGSPEHSLLDSKDFYRPVVTPYELQLALTDGEWSGPNPTPYPCPCPYSYAYPYPYAYP